MAEKKESKMGLGLIVGMVLGALGGIFLAPKSGKENREAVAAKMKEMQEMMQNGDIQKRVKEVFGDLSEESVQAYATAKEGVVKGLEEMKNMDADDYAKLVQNVVDRVKESAKIGSETLTKLKKQLISDWPFMKEEVEKKSRKKSN